MTEMVIFQAVQWYIMHILIKIVDNNYAFVLK